MIKKLTRVIFTRNKKLFSIYHIEVDKILISIKEPYGNKSSFKYFLGHDDDDVIRPWCIELPQMIGYVKHFDSNNGMFFQVNDIDY